MSNHEIEKIKMKKAEVLIKQQLIPNKVVKIGTLDEFNKIINDYDKMIIIDFWAIWCGPCMFFAPVFEKLQQEYFNEFVFLKVNVDELPEIARQYSITGIPTTIFVRKGKIVNKIVGAMNFESMKEIIEQMKDCNN